MSSLQSAKEFVSHYHNKQYNFIEPEACKLSMLLNAHIDSDPNKKN